MPLLSPPPPPPPPPAGAPGRGRRRQRRLRRLRSKRPERRDWADLPLDAILCVLRRLGDAELMFGGAARACRSWHDAAREPELSRRVDTRGHSRLFRETVSLDRMARLAVWLAAGELEAFLAEGHADDDLLLFLAQHAPSLKSLHLIECYSVHTDAFAEAILRFPLLEELELSQCNNILATWVVDLVATACPRLKHFKHTKERISRRYFARTPYPADNSEAFAIARMRELRTLQLLRDGLDSKGLAAILDNCPRLEFLDIRSCDNVVMDSGLRAKCARIKTKKLYPYNWTDDWEHFQSGCHDDDFTDDSEYFEPGSPISYCSTCFMFGDGICDEQDCQFMYAQDCESDDSDRSYYFSGVEETELEEHERILGKAARRYLRI